MSAITIRFDHSRCVAIDNTPLSENAFTAELLLSPDGDIDLSRDYGMLQVTVRGDSTKVPDLKLSDLERWVTDGLLKLLQSQPQAAQS